MRKFHVLLQIAFVGKYFAAQPTLLDGDPFFMGLFVMLLHFLFILKYDVAHCAGILRHVEIHTVFLHDLSMYIFWTVFPAFLSQNEICLGYCAFLPAPHDNLTAESHGNRRTCFKGKVVLFWANILWTGRPCDSIEYGLDIGQLTYMKMEISWKKYEDEGFWRLKLTWQLGPSPHCQRCCNDHPILKKQQLTRWWSESWLVLSGGGTSGCWVQLGGCWVVSWDDPSWEDGGGWEAQAE